MRRSDRNFTKIPDGKLGIIALEGCKELGKTIDDEYRKYTTDNYYASEKIEEFIKSDKK